MHKAGARPPDGVFQRLSHESRESMRKQTSPSRFEHPRTLQRKAGEEQRHAQRHQHRPAPQPSTEIACLFKPREMNRSEKPGEGQIDLKESPKHDAEGQRREEDGRSKPKPHALPEWVHGTQSARKTLNSPRVAAWRSDTHTSFLPSGENIGKLLK